MSGLTTGKLARAADVNVETLRYYERRGLLPDPPRRDSGYRQYPPESVERLRFIKGAQELGFTLEEIKELLTLRVDESATKADVRQRSQAKVKQIEGKIQALQTMREALTDLIDQCSGEGPTSDCPILEAMETHQFLQETSIMTKTFEVPNISCEHCTRTVENEVGEIAGVTSVQADEARKQVTVEWGDPATWNEIEGVLKEINYPPVN